MDSSFTDDMIEILMPLLPDETPQDLLDQMTDSLDSPSPPLPYLRSPWPPLWAQLSVSVVALVANQHDDDLDAYLMDRQTDHQQKGGKMTHTTCPIPGCGRVVKRLWNHLRSGAPRPGPPHGGPSLPSGKLLLNQYHKKMGDEIGTAQCPKRRRWTPEEERVLNDEVEKVQNRVPSRKDCLELIRQHPFVFVNRIKVQVQDKFRRIIRKRYSL